MSCIGAVCLVLRCICMRLVVFVDDYNLIMCLVRVYLFFFFFFSSRRRHTRSLCDWSSDVCSSDLGAGMLRSILSFKQYQTSIRSTFSIGDQSILTGNMLAFTHTYLLFHIFNPAQKTLLYQDKNALRRTAFHFETIYLLFFLSSLSISNLRQHIFISLVVCHV